MGQIPTSKAERIQFFEEHIALWTANATDIGVLPSECTALAALITSARNAFEAQGIAADSAKSATLTCTTAVQTMYTLGKAMVTKIRAYADTTNNPAVYTLANISPPAPRTPMPPPGKCTDLIVEILSSGALFLRWKCANPPGATGTVYEMRRKVGAGPFNFIGAAGSTREFEDGSLPIGSSAVTYEITGLRGTTRGPGVQFNVNFGVAGGGGAFSVASVEEVPAAKLAA